MAWLTEKIMKKQMFILLLFLLIALSSATRGEAAEQDDSQGYWEFRQSESIQYTLTPAFLVNLGKEFHYRGGNNCYTDTDISVSHRRQEKPDVSIGYKIIETLETSGWQQENRIYGDFVPQWKIGDVECSDRNRLEYRFFHDGSEDYLRYRNKLELAVPVKIFRHTIKPYIADEVFFDKYSGGTFQPSKNQYTLGIRNDMREHLHIDIAVMRQTNAKYRDEGEPLKEFNAFEVKLKFAF
jgi:hypothetical protein